MIIIKMSFTLSNAERNAFFFLHKLPQQKQISPGQSCLSLLQVCDLHADHQQLSSCGCTWLSASSSHPSCAQLQSCWQESQQVSCNSLLHVDTAIFYIIQQLKLPSLNFALHLNLIIKFTHNFNSRQAEIVCCMLILLSFTLLHQFKLCFTSELYKQLTYVLASSIFLDPKTCAF